MSQEKEGKVRQRDGRKMRERETGKKRLSKEKSQRSH